MAPRKKSSKNHGVDSEVAGALSVLNDEWDQVEEKSGGDFDDVPAGNYAVRIDKAELNNSKNSGRFQCSWTMTIVDGEFKNRKLWKHDGLADTENLGWMRTTLARLGYEWPASAEELPDTLSEIPGDFAEVTVKVNGDYTNVYINKALDEEEIDTSDLEEYEEEEGEESAEYGDLTGSRVTVDIDGTDYDGEVTASFSDDALRITVTFDDGEVISYSQEEMDESVTIHESEEEAEEEEYEEEDDEEEEADEEYEEEDDEEEEEEDGEEVTEEGEVNATFDDEKLSEKHTETIAALAEENDFDPDDYGTWTECLCDIAEYKGVSGDFKTPASLLKACK